MTSSFGAMLAFVLASSTDRRQLMMLLASCCLPPRGSCLVMLQPLHIMSGNRMLLPLCTFVAAVANVNMPCQFEGDGEEGAHRSSSSSSSSNIPWLTLKVATVAVVADNSRQ